MTGEQPDSTAARGDGAKVSLKSFRELRVWQESYALCLDLYRLTRGLPKEEKYGLSSQLRRAAVSIPSNIAEGYGRKTTQEYIQFLYIAYGSECELETQVQLCRDLEYITPDTFDKVYGRIKGVERMLKALVGAKRRGTGGPPFGGRGDSGGQGRRVREVRCVAAKDAGAGDGLPSSTNRPRTGRVLRPFSTPEPLYPYDGGCLILPCSLLPAGLMMRRRVN